MQHETIFNRPDGSKIKAIISFGSSCVYDVSVWRLEKSKRKWVFAIDNDSYEHRSRSFPEGRRQHIQEQVQKLLSKEEIFSAKLELWEKLKPTI